MGSTRQQAIRKGESTYLGAACKNGHQGLRYVTNKACIACCRAYDFSYRRHNRENINLTQRQWRALNADKVQGQRRRGVQSRRASDARRRAAKRGVEAKATKSDLYDLKDIQNGQCAYCGCSDNLHLDHKVPLSRGGPHIAANLQWLCGACNMTKGAKTDVEFRAEKGIPDLTEWEGL